MSFDFTNYTAYAVGGKMISCLSMDLIVNGAAAVIFPRRDMGCSGSIRSINKGILSTK